MATRVAVVTGAGGFIGGHLVKRLINGQEYDKVLAVDKKPKTDWWQLRGKCTEAVRDLSELQACFDVMNQAISLGSEISIYNLAADMGGMGFIENNKCDCMLNVLINTHMLMAARQYHRWVKRFLFTSSACAYAAVHQYGGDAGQRLMEEQAYPAQPEDGYGWEKLFSERMCRHFREDYGIETRVVRLHNVYGPHGSWNCGREKAPAALCRKVAMNQEGEAIDMWGDGSQLRSFLWIDDAVHGLIRMCHSDVTEVVNLGSDVTINIRDLLALIGEIAFKEFDVNHQMDKPRGVDGRSSDNTLWRAKFGSRPDPTELVTGLEKLYEWIQGELK